MYDELDEFFNRKYHDQIQILKSRYQAFFEMDGSRRKWKARAEKAEKRIEELERSRRVLKLKQRALEEALAELKALNISQA
jgi:chromosome segregation ATPase